MANASSVANILPWRFTPERARAARALARKPLQRGRDSRALAKSNSHRLRITGPAVARLLSDAIVRVESVEAKLARMEAERARLDATPSRAEYIQAGVERHLGRALLPSPQVLKRRKKLTQSPAPLAPGPSENATAEDLPGFDPTAKPQPRPARPRAGASIG